MGINYGDFIKEANRVLKPGGKLFIAEPTSRLEDVKLFAELMRAEMGFNSLKISKLKDFFYIMIFEKEKDATKLQ